MTPFPVVEGGRYAVGLRVPWGAGLLGGAGAQMEALVQGFHGQGSIAVPPDSPAGRQLEDQGWTDAVAYEPGKAPIAEPSPADLVVLLTRSGPSETIDLDELGQGLIAWAVPLTAGQGGAVEPGTSGAGLGVGVAEIVVGALAIGLVLGVVVLVAQD